MNAMINTNGASPAVQLVRGDTQTDTALRMNRGIPVVLADVDAAKARGLGIIDCPLAEAVDRRGICQ